MKDSKIFEATLEMAKSFQNDSKKVPDLFNSILSETLPHVSNDEKIKLQSLVKESNKLIEDAKKSGDFLKIKKSIDELTNKYGRNNHT
jgi:hypothetical protein